MRIRSILGMLSTLSIIAGAALVGYLVFISNDLLQIGATTVVDPTPEQDRATFLAIAGMIVGGSLVALGLLYFLRAFLLRRYAAMTLIRAGVIGIMSLAVMSVLEVLLHATPAYPPAMVLTTCLLGAVLTFSSWATLAKLRQ